MTNIIQNNPIDLQTRSNWKTILVNNNRISKINYKTRTQEEMVKDDVDISKHLKGAIPFGGKAADFAVMGITRYLGFSGGGVIKGLGQSHASINGAVGVVTGMFIGGAVAEVTGDKKKATIAGAIAGAGAVVGAKVLFQKSVDSGLILTAITGASAGAAGAYVVATSIINE